MGIKNRNIVVAVLLSFVTCGIYGIFWCWNMYKDASKVIGEEKILTFILMLFLPFIGFYLLEKDFAAACASKGIEHKDNSVIYLILPFLSLAIVDYCLVQNDLNKLADVAE